MSVGAVNKQTGDRIPTAGMPAIDDALDLTSVNPVQNAIITAALANKQDKTDNNLETTSKTVVGAVNELKSGLTNVDVALSVPDGTGKNVLPLTLPNIKAYSTSGTWADNVYTKNGVDYTVTNTNGTVTGITANGTPSADASIGCPVYSLPAGTYKVSGCPANGSAQTYAVTLTDSSFNLVARDTGNGATFTLATAKDIYAFCDVRNGLEIPSGGLTFYPMIRLASVSDPTYAPYIPSVESRIEAVESGLTNCVKTVKLNVGSSGATQSIPLDNHKIYDIEVSVANNASVYNYYHWFAMYGQSSWITAEISKVEKSTTNVALTYTIDSSNNLVVTNSGNWGAAGVIKIATVDK